MSGFVQQSATPVSFTSSDSWVLLSPIEQSIKRKIEAVGVPLKDWDINIYRGILTGCNDAFIISTEKRDEILANCVDDDERQRTEELIRPILRGRDIKRYSYEWADLWLIATFPARNYDIEQYPAVKKYLLSFAESMLREAGLDWIADSYLADFCYQKLAQTGQSIEIAGQRVRGNKDVEKARKKTSNKWFETQDSISYWDDFSNQKIVWARLMRLTKRDIDSFPRFAVVKEKVMTVDSLCFFTGKEIENICKLLNSKYAAYYFLRNIAALDNGGLQMRQQYIEEIPLPMVTSNDIRDEDIFIAFSFSKEEIEFIHSYIEMRKKEIVE